jgi:hypothetical protein
MKIIGGVLAAFSSWRFVSADMGGIDSFLKEVAAVTPGMDGYDELKKIWITSNESNVAAFLQPTTIEELKGHIHKLREYDIRPMIQCGGHSFSSYASQKDGGVTIDTSLLGAKIEVDPVNLTATIFGCVLQQQVSDAVGPLGLAFIGGHHGHVGYSGYVLGGGQGFRGRIEGLAIDKVLHFRVVTAEGEEVLATPNNEHSDLFWAMKGAGAGNFGVLVETKIELFPHEGIEVWGTLEFPYETREEASIYFQKYVEHHHTLDRKLNFRMADNAFNGGGDMLFADFAYFGGGKDIAEKVMLDFMKDKMGVDTSTVNIITSAEYDSLHMQTPFPEGEETWTLDIGRRAGSAYMTKVSLETSRWIIDHFLDDSHPCQGGKHWAFTACGGAIKDVSKTATAFWAREAEVELEFSVGYDYNIEGMDQHCENFINEVVEQMQSDKGTSYLGSYYNHVADGYDDYPTRFWGKNLKQLIAVKKKYDPDNFWQWRYSIPVKGAKSAKSGKSAKSVKGSKSKRRILRAS